MDNDFSPTGEGTSHPAEGAALSRLLRQVAGAARGPPQNALHDEQRVQKVLDGLTEEVALVDSEWRILAVNEAWNRTAAAGNYQTLLLHGNYRDFAKRRAAEGDKAASIVVSALAEIDAGERRHFHHQYAAAAPWLGRFYLVTISVFELRGERFATVTRTDVTKVEKLRLQRRRLGSRLLRAQENERRRIARDLHDSTAQLLIGLQLGLARLKRGGTSEESRAAFDEIEDIVDSVQREIRSLSFICHPPALESGEIGPTLQAMVEGFARRTGLNIELNAVEVGNISPSVEATLYRFAQEALANIYRHAKATTVRLSLISRNRFLHLLINDDGSGLNLSSNVPWPNTGVGIAGMKERVREMGGRLSTHRFPAGTALMASLPRQKRSLHL